MKKNHLLRARERGATRAAGGSQDPTRSRLLEVAGEVFGEKGFQRATGKEICARAGTNNAAINYHFDGMVGLYAAAVDEAAERLVTFESLQAAVAARQSPRAKLEAFLGTLVRALTGPAGTSWAVRLIAREVTAPSPELESFRRREMMPRLRLLGAIVGEITGLPEDHPVVARGCVSTMAPCFLLLTSQREHLRERFPGLSLSPAHAEDLVRHMVEFAYAGLRAVSASERRGRRKRAARRP